eukprot:6768751-Pyramimonas_sp.AAC.1
MGSNVPPDGPREQDADGPALKLTDRCHRIYLASGPRCQMAAWAPSMLQDDASIRVPMNPREQAAAGPA